MFISMMIAAALTAPQPGALKTYGDWTVGCDNGLACQAVALVPESADRDDYLLIVIRRAAANVPMTLAFPLMDTVAPGKAYALAVDGAIAARGTARGKPPENAADVSMSIDARTLAALRNGQRASLAGTKISASLKGLAASLLYMDAQQRRAAPALPVIAQPAATARPPRTLTTARALAALSSEAKQCDDPTNDLKPEASRLDATHSLVLIAHPCGNGAYNLFSTGLIIDEAGRAAPVRFDAAPNMSIPSEGGLVNADWDARTRRLGIFSRGRGIGDCGTIQSYAWDGTRFRLAEQAEMGECRGSTDYIPTWRARVVER